MVWIFRRTFCKKPLHNLMNQPALQFLVNIAGQLLFSLSSLLPTPRSSRRRRRQTAPLSSADQAPRFWWPEMCWHRRPEACWHGWPVACWRGRPAAGGRRHAGASGRRRAGAGGRWRAGVGGRRRAGAPGVGLLVAGGVLAPEAQPPNRAPAHAPHRSPPMHPLGVDVTPPAGEGGRLKAGGAGAPNFKGQRRSKDRKSMRSRG
jgi:hypothetical protein